MERHALSFVCRVTGIPKQEGASRTHLAAILVNVNAHAVDEPNQHDKGIS